MRTKTLLLTVALSAAGVASSMAQVYSQNAVGYVNLSLKRGFNLIANPLRQTDTSLETLIPSAPDQTVFYSFSPVTGYTTYTFDLSGTGGWDPPAAGHFDLGKGAFVSTSTDFTITVVGEVAQGTLSNPTAGPGFDLKGSMVPQTGTLQGQLGYTPVDQEVIYRFSPITGYTTYTYDLTGVGGWDPEDPPISVGEGFFTSSPSAHPWTRVFTVN